MKTFLNPGFFILILFPGLLFPQVSELERLGQTPGGAAYHVNYDPVNEQLLVGCGTSIWLYDMTDPANPVIMAKRALMGIVNESDFYGNVIFLAATHDGVYALDRTTATLDILDQYEITSPNGDKAAYDLYRAGDTLYVADNVRVRSLKFSLASGFSEISEFGPLTGSFCVTGNSGHIAVGSQGLIWGFVNIYDKDDLSTPVATWQSDKIKLIQNLNFSITQDDILFVCGGPRPLDLFMKSYLFALEYSGTNLSCVDTVIVNGLPVVAQANVMNLDMKGDTLFVATGCAIDPSMGFPLAYIPVLDAAGLPASPMDMIGYINPGLWHFDVALMHGTPYMATSSEWLGVAINNVSELIPLDTLLLIETGGWAQSCKVFGDTLWVAQEGWGIAAYNTDSIKYSSGFMTDSRILHLYSLHHHYFVPDFEFFNDSLLVLANGHVFNLNPWFYGGKPDSLYHLNLEFAVTLHKMHTECGPRLITGAEVPLFGFGGKTMSLYDPLIPSGDRLDEVAINNSPKAITVDADKVFYGIKYDSTGNDYYLAVSEVQNDTFILLDTILMFNGFGEIGALAADNDLIVAGRGNMVLWFDFDGEHLVAGGSFVQAGLVVSDLTVKNRFVYIADKMYGLQVLDLHNVGNPSIVATCKGTEGWGSNNFGSVDVTLGVDGTIYLTDFNAGVIMIEAYDTTLVKVPSKSNDLESLDCRVFPNPCGDNFRLDIKCAAGSVNVCNLTVCDLNGREIYTAMNMLDGNHTISTSSWKDGVYILTVYNTEGKKNVSKIVKLGMK
ncbi:MAG: T9SS type A sorting domain-containing protein [Bacteroidetes bacterium]|nr:T9SS type A sorting domain-containing protein [Bacteroidota bacterium]